MKAFAKLRNVLLIIKRCGFPKAMENLMLPKKCIHLNVHNANNFANKSIIWVYIWHPAEVKG